ncbi:MAG: DUF58 domain-containing protein [Candidatus Wallbacteria bacterium]|nr:DUF58 domain-containing protein [Candidatus Wallbacteria bacterium]
MGAIPTEILRKVRRIEIKTRSLVENVFSGQYHSVFKGRGMEFAEVREYQYGDDIRRIDWNVSARMGSPFVKQFQEERELTVMLVVDASGSGDFGTYRQFKGEMAVEIAALLAFSAIKNNDRVGLLMFTDEVEKFVPPKKGRLHVLRVLRELLYFEPRRKGTNIVEALRYLERVLVHKSVVFLLSDFMSRGFDKTMRVAARRHDLIAVPISDPREEDMPPVGMVELEDAETGERLLVDTFDPGFRKAYRDLAHKGRQELLAKLRAMKVDTIPLSTGPSGQDTARQPSPDPPYVKPLVAFFRERARRIR